MAGPGTILLKKSANSGSMRALPAKPRFQTGQSNRRDKIAGRVMPLRDAQQPCTIDVP